MNDREWLESQKGEMELDEGAFEYFIESVGKILNDVPRITADLELMARSQSLFWLLRNKQMSTDRLERLRSPIVRTPRYQIKI